MLRQSPNQPVRKTVMTINNINMDDQGKVDIKNTIKKSMCYYKLIRFIVSTR